MHNACMSQGSLQRRCLLPAGLAPISNSKQLVCSSRSSQAMSRLTSSCVFLRTRGAALR